MPIFKFSIGVISGGNISGGGGVSHGLVKQRVMDKALQKLRYYRQVRYRSVRSDVVSIYRFCFLSRGVTYANVSETVAVVSERL